MGSGAGELPPVDLLPTPRSQDGNGYQQNPEADIGNNGRTVSLADRVTRLLPTPRSSDCFGAGHHGDGGPDLRTTITLLPTPSTADGDGGHLNRSGDRKGELLLPGQAREMDGARWGKYAPAIQRWEAVTRPAPAPTEPNKNGNPRLSAAFSEWLMGWPDGWVTDPVIGISRNDQLRIVGNGVVVKQAEAALRWLLGVSGGSAPLSTGVAPAEPVPPLMPTPRNSDGERGPSMDSGGVRLSGQPRQKDLNTVVVRELKVSEGDA